GKKTTFVCFAGLPSYEKPRVAIDRYQPVSHRNRGRIIGLSRSQPATCERGRTSELVAIAPKTSKRDSEKTRRTNSAARGLRPSLLAVPCSSIRKGRALRFTRCPMFGVRPHAGLRAPGGDLEP